MAKIITIDNNRYVLPEGMTTKDIQTLAGMLISLVKVDHYYIYPDYENLFFAGEGVQVGVTSTALMTKEDAKAKSDASRAAQEAKKKAEEAAA